MSLTLPGRRGFTSGLKLDTCPLASARSRALRQLRQRPRLERVCGSSDWQSAQVWVSTTGFAAGALDFRGIVREGSIKKAASRGSLWVGVEVVFLQSSSATRMVTCGSETAAAFLRVRDARLLA